MVIDAVLGEIQLLEGSDESLRTSNPLVVVSSSTPPLFPIPSWLNPIHSLPPDCFCPQLADDITEDVHLPDLGDGISTVDTSIFQQGFSLQEKE